MEKELKAKIEGLKLETTGKKPKGCKSCKKKKPINELPPVIEEDEFIPFIPTPEDIRLAYIELGNKDKDKKEFINKVYQFVFDENFDFGCTACMNVQVRKLKHYITDVLKLNVL